MVEGIMTILTTAIGTVSQIGCTQHALPRTEMIPAGYPPFSKNMPGQGQWLLIARKPRVQDGPVRFVQP